VDDAEPNMMLDDATSAADEVASGMAELTISDDSTGSLVLVGVATGLVALSDSGSLTGTGIGSVVGKATSIEDEIMSEELTVMGTESATSELTGVDVDSISLDAEVVSKLTVGEEETPGNVVVDAEATSLEPSLDEETTSELAGVAEDEASVTENNTSDDVTTAILDEEIPSGVGVITEESVSVKVATDRVETAEEEAASDATGVDEGAVITSVEAAADDAMSDELLLGDKASEAGTADETMTAEDTTGEEDSTGVDEALVDRVGAVADEADDLTTVEAERVETEDLTGVDRVEVVRLEEAIVDEVLAEVVRVELVRTEEPRLEEVPTEEVREEDD
jgi:hypothetical protein